MKDKSMKAGDLFPEIKANGGHLACPHTRQSSNFTFCLYPLPFILHTLFSIY